MVLIGNKSDLHDERQICYEEALDLAQKWSIPFFETSAFARVNVDECFHQLIREVDKSLSYPLLPTSPNFGGKMKTGKVKKGGRGGGCIIL